jgi:hypothetical protein
LCSNGWERKLLAQTQLGHNTIGGTGFQPVLAQVEAWGCLFSPVIIAN